MTVKTVSLCDVSIFSNACIKLQKVDKGDGARHKKRKMCRHNIRDSQTSNKFPGNGLFQWYDKFTDHIQIHFLCAMYQFAVIYVCLKLQKVDKGYCTQHYRIKV